MHTFNAPQQVSRHLQRPAVFAISFFASAVAILLTAAVVAWFAVKATANHASWHQTGFIASFIVSTVLLITGSVQLIRASTFVRMERQAEFRRCLAWAVLVGTAFMSVQSCGLTLLAGASGMGLASEVRHAAFAFIFLHAIHVTIAVLFLLYVFLRATSDRYDHEYSWGVTVSGWVWHGLGVIWMAILTLFIIAGSVSLAR